MPLEFHSISHGAVPFGFFNIKTDMLLLQKRFFFAHRFCEVVKNLAAGGAGSESTLPCWRIDHSAMIGDLHGAIRGDYLKGFIGATYGRWPFPKKKADFKQDPDGHQTREEVESLIEHVSLAEEIVVRWNAQVVSLDTMSFSVEEFARLVAYVDRGGHPRWRDDRRPDYVADMTTALQQASSPLLG